MSFQSYLQLIIHPVLVSFSKIVPSNSKCFHHHLIYGAVTVLRVIMIPKENNRNYNERAYHLLISIDL